MKIRDLYSVMIWVVVVIGSRTDAQDSSPATLSEISFELQFLDEINPQQVDIRQVLSPEGLAKLNKQSGIPEIFALALASSMPFQAIIQQHGEQIQICSATDPGLQTRPTQFMVSPNTVIYELRRLVEASPPPSATESPTNESRLSPTSPPYDGDFRSAPANATVTTKIYHVGSIVTGSLFTKGVGLIDEKHMANQEAEIEKEMQSLVESIIAACTSPPVMIKAFGSQRKLIVRTTPEGQLEIESPLTALGNPSDSAQHKIRLRVD